MQFLLRFLEGILIGTGGILPGVSGGALCVVFGIYRPLMELFSNPFKNLKKYFWMLFPYGLGIGVGFIGLAGLVDYVLRTHEALAVCAFVGLILGMVPQLFRDAGEQGRGKGDQHVRLTVEIPRNLNESQKKLLRDFEATLGDKNYSKRKSFFEKLKESFEGKK